MGKKYLKGFADLGFIPVTKNDASGYTATGERKMLPGTRTCAPTDNRSDYSIPGDDGIYDSGSEWADTTLVVTVNEMGLDLLATLGGVDVGSVTDELEEGAFDVPPVVALTFSALRGDGGYRLYRYYAAKCTGYKISHATRGENNEAQTYELTFKCSPRVYDNKIRGTKDIAKGAAKTWLDTIPALPDTPSA